MLDWMKKLLAMQPMRSAAENMHYIEKYKDFDSIIATKYKNASGIVVDGIVTPLKVDNRQLCSMTDQQGTTPHCAGYSICNIIEALIWKKTGKLVNLDADQVYARAKKIDGDVSSDGTYLECAIRAAIELGGFGKQSKDVKIGFLYNQKNDATLVQLKRLVHKHDFLHAGFMIDDGWYRATNSNYIIKRGTQCAGGHAVVICGYDNDGVYIQNSWGKEYGAKGFVVLPWNLVKQQLMYCCFIENFNV